MPNPEDTPSTPPRADNDPTSRHLLDIWNGLKPTATRGEAAQIALLMAARAEPDIADVVAKMAFWRATSRSPSDALPQHLADALAYSAFLDLVALTGLEEMAQSSDLEGIPDNEARTAQKRW
jgi:hypothetical protein